MVSNVSEVLSTASISILYLSTALEDNILVKAEDVQRSLSVLCSELK